MPEVKRSQPVSYQIEHDGLDTDSYTLIRNGVDVETKPFDPAGVVFQDADGEPDRGTVVMAVRADGPDGSATSDPVEVVVRGGAPSKPKLVVVVTGG